MHEQPETPSEIDGLFIGYMPLNNSVALNVRQRLPIMCFDLVVPPFLPRLSSIFEGGAIDLPYNDNDFF